MSDQIIDLPARAALVTDLLEVQADGGGVGSSAQVTVQSVVALAGGATGPTGATGPSISVTDGSTTVDPVASISFTGATVTDGGGGVAQVAVGGGGVLLQKTVVMSMADLFYSATHFTPGFQFLAGIANKSIIPQSVITILQANGDGVVPSDTSSLNLFWGPSGVGTIGTFYFTLDAFVYTAPTSNMDYGPSDGTITYYKYVTASQSGYQQLPAYADMVGQFITIEDSSGGNSIYGAISTFSIQSAGTLFAPGDTATVDGAGGGTNDTILTVDTVDGGGGILTAHITQNLALFNLVSPNHTLTAATGIGTGAAITIESLDYSANPCTLTVILNYFAV